jgi:hypothetical protein
MNEGRIVALDSPENLKKKYDAGSVEEVFIKIARPANQRKEVIDPKNN